MKKCYQVHASDNVATMLEDTANESVVVLGASIGKTIESKGAIRLGHKLALTIIKPGAKVIKYGVPIGIATQRILPGEWVHLHNCRSQVDERSTEFDIETGSATDTAYE
jgi:altronate dehydratase small subunit